jgi:hypothetical protein
MACKYCKGACVKAGFQRNSKQKYRCKYRVNKADTE